VARALRGYKAIAVVVSDVWGVDVSVQSIFRWSKREDDPIPVKHITPTRGQTRSIVLADEAAIRRWAQRRLQPA
jgi:hypothetical protein